MQVIKGALKMRQKTFVDRAPPVSLGELIARVRRPPGIGIGTGEGEKEKTVRTGTRGTGE